MSAFLPISARRYHLLLMALCLACGPAIQRASGTEIPDLSTGTQFSPEQQAQIRAKQDELAKTKDNIELIKAKIAAFEEKIASQKTSIASLAAEIGKKEFETGLRTDRPATDPASSTAVTKPKIELPSKFIAGVTPRIVIIEGDKGNGTGFLCRSEGEVWVYTAAHVLSGNRTIAVRDNTGRTYRDFEFIECAEGVDLVRLKPKDTGMEALDLVPPDSAPKIGEIIVAIGNSLGAGSLSGEPGHIMSVREDMWEVDAEIIPGNSGGPVISLESGNVVGIVTHLTIKRARNQYTSIEAEKTEVKRFAARLDRKWEWRRMPVSRFVKEWEHIEAMDRESSIAWASIYLMHTGPVARRGSQNDTNPDQVKLAEAILARDRQHIQAQRVDEWLKRYRAAGTVRHNELIEEGNQIIDRNLDEIRLKANAPKSGDFSWFHRQSYDAEVAWREKLTERSK
jgi:S1-C subfamily serine protease